jgi:hypothetical protein
MEGPVPNNLARKRMEESSENGTRHARGEGEEEDDLLIAAEEEIGSMNAGAGAAATATTPAQQQTDLSASEIYQLMSYHVQLTERRRARFACMDNGAPCFFDEASLLLVYVQNQELRVVSCRPATPPSDATSPRTLAHKAGADPKPREEILRFSLPRFIISLFIYIYIYFEIFEASAGVVVGGSSAHKSVHCDLAPFRMSFKTLDATAILGAKVAPDNKYIAIQRSPTEIVRNTLVLATSWRGLSLVPCCSQRTSRAHM